MPERDLVDVPDGAGRIDEAAAVILAATLNATFVRAREDVEHEAPREQGGHALRLDELAFMATHDPLTGLPNRYLLIDRVEQALARSRRRHSPVTALHIAVDGLDGLDGLEEGFGGGAGDEMVRGIAARLDAITRETDSLGRLDDGDFLLIADEALPPGPQLIAERMLEALAQPFELFPAPRRAVSLSASVGIAAAERIGAEQLLEQANAAMRRARAAGRNRWVVFESWMRDGAGATSLAV